MVEQTSTFPQSLWAATAPPGPACPAITGNEDADVVVVGGGYTGLSTAVHLAKEGKRVVVLEAEEPGLAAQDAMADRSIPVVQKCCLRRLLTRLVSTGVSGS